MKEVVLILMALAIFGGAILSLEVRRRHPGVGAVSGAIVLILILLGFGGIVLSTLAQQRDGGDFAGPSSELGPIVAVLVALVGVAGAIGRFQGRPLRMSRGIAWLGGVGQLVPLTLVMVLVRPETGFDTMMAFPAFSVSENAWIGLCVACVAAEVLAPLILVRVLRRKVLRERREGGSPHETHPPSAPNA